MIRLRRTDLEAVLTFLGDVAELEFEEPYPIDFVVRLQDLVPCDAITYQDLDYRAHCLYTMVGLPDEDGAVGEEVFWSVAPCPIFSYRDRTRDLDAVRMSDVIGRRQYQELSIYQEYFRPNGIDHAIDLRLARPRRYRSFILFRRPGASDFSERDRGVLELLRPHLYRLEAQAALRRRLAETLRDLNGDADRSVYRDLTSREREIVELVAEGKTNAEIAAILWVAPSTVKKHLEHVYAKIGVGRRAAVAAARYAPRG